MQSPARERKRPTWEAPTESSTPATGIPWEQIQAMTAGGLGVDVGFECVGHGMTLNVALGAIRKGGTAAIVGVFEEPASLDVNDLVLSERSLLRVLGYVDDFPRAIALLADGRIDVDPPITSRVALDDAIEGGFRELLRNKDEHVKILIDAPGAGSAASQRPAGVGPQWSPDPVAFCRGCRAAAAPSRSTILR